MKFTYVTFHAALTAYKYPTYACTYLVSHTAVSLVYVLTLPTYSLLRLHIICIASIHSNIVT